MADTNSILSKIDAALEDSDTPRWAVPVLLCIRNDHERLHDHLAAHRQWSQPARQILVSVLTALAVMLAAWIMAGSLPAIFG